MSARILPFHRPQEPIRLMDRPVYRPTSSSKFIGAMLVSMALWSVFLFAFLIFNLFRLL
jgi:hypothetical protein